MNNIHMEPNDTDFIYLTDKLDYLASSRPNAIAFRFLNDPRESMQSLTYRQLAVRTKRLAGLLKERSLPGERILLLYPPGLDFIVACFACLYADLIPVPAIPPDNKNIDGLLAIVEDCGPDMILCTESVLSGIDVFEAKKRLQNGEESLKSQKLKMLYDLPWFPTDMVSGSKVLKKNKGMEMENRNEIALLQYDFSSDNTPKGTIITHRNLYYNSMLISNAFNIDSNTHMVSWMFPYNDTGLLTSIIAPVFSEIPATLISPLAVVKKPLVWLQVISDLKDKATVVSGGNDFIYEHCSNKIKEEQVEQLNLKHWKIAFNSSPHINLTTIENFMQKFSKAGFSSKSFLPVYSLAEGTSIVTAGVLESGLVVNDFSVTLLRNNIAVASSEKGDSIRLSGVGRIQEGHPVFIMDINSGFILEDGKVGEIIISGPSVSSGYYKNAELNSAFFDRSPDGKYFYKTGDLGFLKEKELYVLGRIKDLMHANENAYYSQGIENTVLHCIRV